VVLRVRRLRSTPTSYFDSLFTLLFDASKGYICLTAHPFGYKMHPTTAVHVLGPPIRDVPKEGGLWNV